MRCSRSVATDVSLAFSRACLFEGMFAILTNFFTHLCRRQFHEPDERSGNIAKSRLKRHDRCFLHGSSKFAVDLRCAQGGHQKLVPYAICLSMPTTHVCPPWYRKRVFALHKVPKQENSTVADARRWDKRGLLEELWLIYTEFVNARSITRAGCAATNLEDRGGERAARPAFYALQSQKLTAKRSRARKGQEGQSQAQSQGGQGYPTPTLLEDQLKFDEELRDFDAKDEAEAQARARANGVVAENITKGRHRGRSRMLAGYPTDRQLLAERQATLPTTQELDSLARVLDSAMTCLQHVHDQPGTPLKDIIKKGMFLPTSLAFCHPFRLCLCRSSASLGPTPSPVSSQCLCHACSGGTGFLLWRAGRCAVLHHGRGPLKLEALGHRSSRR